MESLSCPPGGLQRAIQHRENRKNSPLNKPGWTSFIIRVTTQGNEKGGGYSRKKTAFDDSRKETEDKAAMCQAE